MAARGTFGGALAKGRLALTANGLGFGKGCCGGAEDAARGGCRFRAAAGARLAGIAALKNREGRRRNEGVYQSGAQSGGKA